MIEIDMLGVHFLIFLFIALCVVGNIVSYMQYYLILLTNSKEDSMKVKWEFMKVVS